MRLTHLDLFSGIGGMSIAAEWAGLETVGFCEFAEYPAKVLRKHWPDVPIWGDIRTLTKESFYERTGLRTVDVVSGGFPCQPFSVAGKQKGKGDDRYLWPEMLRVIRELAARWVVGENVPGILRIAAADVIQDLEREGYNVAVFDFEAAAIGAFHRRERIFFVGNAKHDGCSAAEELRGRCSTGSDRQEKQAASGQSEGAGGRYSMQGVYGRAEKERATDAIGDVADADEPRLQGRECCDLQERAGKWPPGASDTSRGDTARGAAEPRLGRVADGLTRWLDEPVDVPRLTTVKEHRADRLKCLGNMVVPQQAYPIFKAIMEVEE